MKWNANAMSMAVLGIAAAIFAGVCWWTLTRTPPSGSGVSSPLVAQPMSVAPGVYLLGKSFPSAVYAVTTSEGLVLVDAGLEADAASVIKQLDELGLDVSQLKAILLTHVHGDHTFGAERLRSLSGAKVYAGQGDCKPLREGGPREAFFSSFDMAGVKLHKTTVDVELAGDEVLELGDTRFVAIAAPGHTPGSVCYLLERPGLRALFTGDVVLCLNPRRGQSALGVYSTYLPPVYGGNARDYLATLRRLRTLNVPDLVLPGHPQMDPSPQVPRLTQEVWLNTFDQGIREMVQLVAQYDTDGADFLDGVPKELLPGLHYLGDIDRAAVYCLVSSKGLFLLDAPGGPSLVGFLSVRFRELGWQDRKPVAVLLTSADRASTAGLDALVRNTGCKVVAPKAGLETIRSVCPTGAEILTEEDLKSTDWLDVRTISLRGRGTAPLAYELRWTGKTVLFSGRIPVRLSVPSLRVPSSLPLQLKREVTGPTGSLVDYLKSLDELEKVKPDLWLPAMPLFGQNANLYDRDWANVLQQNRLAVEHGDWDMP